MPRSSVSIPETPPDDRPATGEFCVLCGRTGLPLVDGVCAECEAARRTFVSIQPHATVVLCPTCGAREVGKHWERAGTSALLGSEDLTRFLVPDDEVAIRRIEWNETGSNPLLKQLHGDVHVRFRGLERVVPIDFTVRLVHRTCPDCSRRSGHYYTALIQLRGPEEGSHRKAPELRARLAEIWDATIPGARADWRNHHSWTERKPEGWDHFFTETMAARNVARLFKDRFGATIKESATLYGMKEGRDLYRVTFAVRLPVHLPGDYYVEKGRLFRLDRPSVKGGFDMSSAASGTWEHWPAALLENARWVGGPERKQVLPVRRAPDGTLEGQHPESSAWVPARGEPTVAVEGTAEFVVDGEHLWYVAPRVRRRQLERHP
ncbi:MAG TPA: 60S ribosomal export protein NMD3 [Thermoplasmata archaeon]|nr:60S ribosomal export protein NMD3 [Thermoplasmata archaeon]